MFPFNPSLLPSLQTRKALLVIDLQNDFVSPDGALPVRKPQHIVDRTIQIAKVFRDSGAGDVIWVRSQFDSHRSLSAQDGQIMVSDDPLAIECPVATARGRRPAPGHHDQAAKESDEEAFLSAPAGSVKPLCVRAGTGGSRFVDEADQARDRSDFILTKTHYSAFASGQQLLQLLRARFATELYICGALTNISIYATALDACQHGYDITLIEDCCGYRSDMRHENAVTSLSELAGCDVTTADDMIKNLQSPSGDENGQAQNGEVVAGGRDTNAGITRGTAESSVRELSSRSDALGLNLPLRSLTVSGAFPAQTGSPERPPTRTVTLPPIPGSMRDDGTVAPITLASGSSPSEDVASDGVLVSEESALEADLSLPCASSPDPGPGDRQQRPIDIAREPTGSQGDCQPGRSPRATSRVQEVRSQRSTSLGKGRREGHQGLLVSEPLCEGDTHIVRNILPQTLAETAFDRLEAEVQWLRMSHQGGEVPRLVAVQGEVDSEGNMPVYRHPSDESPPLRPFSPTVLEIKSEVEKQLGHPLNHVLIQLYRGGNDYISEHSDKSLDIVHGSFISNVSLGAERVMVFRTKRVDKDPSRAHEKADISPLAASPDPTKSTAEPPAAESPKTAAESSRKRRTERAQLPHNSLCRMGLNTNMRWLHAIRQDKRADREKTAAELAFAGRRISLTFRRIGTYLNDAQTLIWGQGAVSKARDGARAVVNGQTPEAVAMLRAFGTENHSSSFDWDAHYGQGFDVLHMTASPRWFTGPDEVVNKRVALLLAHLGVSYAKGSTGASADAPDAVKLVDSDPARSAVEGHAAIMLYLDAVYGGGSGKGGAARDDTDPPALARRLTRFHQGLSLLERWRSAQGSESGRAAQRLLRRELAAWDGYAREVGCGYIAGGKKGSIADYSLWPVLHDMVRVYGVGFFDGYANLRRYYQHVEKSEAVTKVFRQGEGADGTSVPAAQ